MGELLRRFNALGFTEESLEDDAGTLFKPTSKRFDMREGGRKAKFAAPYVNLSANYNREKKPDLRS